MGRIGRLIQTAIEKFIVQTVETYAGVNLTAETFAPSGDDSPPLAEDRIVLVQVDGTGNFVAVGVLNESQGAKPGEKILFSRDDKGNVRATVRLLSDGTVQVAAADANGTEQAALTVGGGGAITVQDKDGNKVESSSSGLKLTDTSGNTVDMSSSGIKLKDAKGGTVEVAGGITVTGAGGGKVEVS